MEMEIVVSEWKIKISDKKQKTIAGKYQVKIGTAVISESEFNDGYNSTDIMIPAELIAKVEAIDTLVKDAIVKNFTT